MRFTNILLIVLVAIGSVPVSGPAQKAPPTLNALSDSMQDMGTGDPVAVHLERDGRLLYVTLRL